jgi:hypothetical protein
MYNVPRELGVDATCMYNVPRELGVDATCMYNVPRELGVDATCMYNVPRELDSWQVMMHLRASLPHILGCSCLYLSSCLSISRAPASLSLLLTRVRGLLMKPFLYVLTLRTFRVQGLGVGFRV